ncbi:hypothetical protein ABT086_04580, partial [Streptomyces mirabilis]
MPDSQSQPPHSSSGQTDTATLLLRGARLTDGRTVDVRLGGGRIEAVGTAGSLATPSSGSRASKVDLDGYLLLPAPAEPHAHGDTALTADGDGPLSYDTQEVQRRATDQSVVPRSSGLARVRRLTSAVGLHRLVNG